MERVQVLCVDCSAAGESVVRGWVGGVCILPPRARRSMGGAVLWLRDRGGGEFGGWDDVDFVGCVVVGCEGVVDCGDVGVAEGAGAALLEPAG